MHTYEEYKCIAEEMMTKKADWYNDVLEMLGNRTGRALIGGGIGAGLGYLAGESPTSALLGGAIGGGLGYLSGGLGGPQTPEEKSKNLINKDYEKRMADYAKSKEPDLKQDRVRQHLYDSSVKDIDADYAAGKTNWFEHKLHGLAARMRGSLSDIALDQQRYDRDLQKAPIEKSIDQTFSRPISAINPVLAPYSIYRNLKRGISDLYGDHLTPTTNKYTYKDQKGNTVSRNYGGTLNQLNARREKNLGSLLSVPVDKQNAAAIYANKAPITSFQTNVPDMDAVNTLHKQWFEEDQQ